MDKYNENIKDILIHLADETGYAIFSISNGKFTFVNSTFSKLFGYSENELLEKVEFSSLIHPEWRDAVISGLGEYEKLICSFKAVKKDGKEFTVTLVSKIYRHNDDYTVTGFILDPSSESEHIRQLKETRVLLETFLNSVGDIVFLIDSKMTFVYSNNPRNLVEFNPDDLIGKRVTNVLPSEILEKFERAFIENKQGKVENYEVEFTILGEPRSFRVKQSPVF